MAQERPHGFIVDIDFENSSELMQSFAMIREVLPRTDYIFELNLRLHWTQSTIQRSNYKLCLDFVDVLRKEDPHLNIFFKLPLCIEEKAKYATFPNCSECVFFEVDWCQWPRQSGRGYYTVPQAYYSKENLNQISRSHFELSAPLTWYYPTRRHFYMAARELESSTNIIDFGSGNGFVTFLLKNEFKSDRLIHAVDPFVDPQFQDDQIVMHKSFPVKMANENWSLFSSLADFYVPLDLCMRQKALPQNIVMFLFPNSFGLGGYRTQLALRGGQILSKVSTPLFDLDELPDLGYHLNYIERVESYFYDNTEFRIYNREKKSIATPDLSVASPYPWEVTASQQDFNLLSSFSKQIVI